MDTDTNAPNSEGSDKARSIRPKQALFNLGQIFATRGALGLLDRTGTNATVLLARHQTGDFGDLDEGDIRENMQAISLGNRILSSYRIANAKIWIITEADRSVTTLLLPSEY